MTKPSPLGDGATGFGARRSVSRVLSLRAKGIAIHLGRLLPSASCDLPGRQRGNPPVVRTVIRPPTAPTRSCSRWGLPCRCCYQQRGALLPHPFTLTVGLADDGGLLSVALSLGSPPPAVNRHRVSVEPGLSLPRRVSPLPRHGHPTVWRTQFYIWVSGPSIPRSLSRAARVAMVSASALPSTRVWRKCRWNAVRVVGRVAAEVS